MNTTNFVDLSLANPYKTFWEMVDVCRPS